MFRWTQDRVQHLVRFVRAMTHRGVPAKRAWECYARLYGTTYTSAMTLYYRGRQQFGHLPPLDWEEVPEEARALASTPAWRTSARKVEVLKRHTLPALSSADQVQQAFAALEALGRTGKEYPAVDADVLSILASLARLVAKAAVGFQAQEVRAEAEALRERVTRLERQAEALRREQEALQHDRERRQKTLAEKLDELGAHVQQLRRVYEALADITEKVAATQAADPPMSAKELRLTLQAEADRLHGALCALDEWKKAAVAQVKASSDGETAGRVQSPVPTNA